MNKKTITRLGIGFLRNIPERPADILINYINNIRLKRIHNRKTPVTLTIFVTSRCNAFCNHCFYWKELNNGKDDISISNLEKLANNLNGLRQILLTGGEPFLRNELAEISKIFHRKGVRAITIPTNGLLT
ncbi:MAG TPA: radical SAM protein, partial [Candidatus Brocadiaceae bacterium]